MKVRDTYKNADKLKKEEEDAKKREQNLMEAKKIQIQEDKNLPTAKVIKIKQGIVTCFANFYVNFKILWY